MTQFQTAVLCKLEPFLCQPGNSRFTAITPSHMTYIAFTEHVNQAVTFSSTLYLNPVTWLTHQLLQLSIFPVKSNCHQQVLASVQLSPLASCSATTHSSSLSFQALSDTTCTNKNKHKKKNGLQKIPDIHHYLNPWFKM